MLIEFRIRNFRSFRDLTEFSMLASSDKSYPENVYTHKESGLKILRSACIYGSNASGKSNLLFALKKMALFVSDSHNGKNGQQINFEQFALDQNFLSESTLFEVDFLQDNTRYLYGFSISSHAVEEEWLYSFPVGRKRLLFKRKQQQYKWGDSWKNQKSRLTELAEMTRENALFLSVASQWNHLDSQTPYNWFQLKIWTSDSCLPQKNTEELVARYIRLNPKFQKQTINLVKQADLGILNLTNEGDRVYFLHQGFDTKGKSFSFPLNLSNESDGTKKLFALSVPLYLALEGQGIMIADGLSLYLHEHLARPIIRKFSELGEENQAQLLMSTHDTTFFDIFRRDQLWIADKSDDGSSNIYSLWEFKTRKGENLQKGYLAGRYGGIPYTDDFLKNELFSKEPPTKIKASKSPEPTEKENQ